MHPQNLKVVFWTMRDRGHTVDEISACLKVSRATLFRWKAQGRTPQARKLRREPRKLGAVAGALTEKVPAGTHNQSGPGSQLPETGSRSQGEPVNTF